MRYVTLTNRSIQWEYSELDGKKSLISPKTKAIASTPVYTASPNQLYRYNVTANDPEGESLQYGLIKSPPGMTINSTTGVLQWTPASVGEFEVVVGATDASLQGGAQQFWVTVAANDAPIITSNPPSAIAYPETYRYDVRAVDPNGDALSYTLQRFPLL